MRRRWYYVKRMLQADRLFAAEMFGRMMQILRRLGLWISFAAVFAAVIYAGRGRFAEMIHTCYETYAVVIADELMRGFLPAWKEEEGAAAYFFGRKKEKQWQERGYEEIFGSENETETLRNKETEDMVTGWEEHTGMEGKAGENGAEMETNAGTENSESRNEEETNAGSGNSDSEKKAETSEAGQEETTLTGLLTNGTSKMADAGIILEKLNDYDYMMKKFYNVHPTTTADRGIMKAETFLSKDLSIKKAEGNDAPQILIYHTHSQETYADYPENPEADVVHVGAYLAELLREKGYQVFHDESVYDERNGKLDRSAAYTYALDGITGILQKYPSIEVVLDLHRDGVSEGTRLVTEIDGTQTARIMFFNGTSMSPDGPIAYLPNPNLQENLAFSFQMQLLAAAKYPGFTRKIYLKGLRYNEHVRERSALIEVGAQTNTYAEAEAAMIPLSDLLDQVLDRR